MLLYDLHTLLVETDAEEEGGEGKEEGDSDHAEEVADQNGAGAEVVGTAEVATIENVGTSGALLS